MSSLNLSTPNPSKLIAVFHVCIGFLTSCQCHTLSRDEKKQTAGAHVSTNILPVYPSTGSVFAHKFSDINASITARKLTGISNHRTGPIEICFEPRFPFRSSALSRNVARRCVSLESVMAILDTKDYRLRLVKYVYFVGRNKE